jgi:hypothetical protein
LRTENGRLTRDLARKDIVNDRLRILLAASNITIPSEMNTVEDSALTTRVEVVGRQGEMQHLRLTTTPADASIPVSSGRPSLNLPPPSNKDPLASIEDAQTAISFVLALEQPCFPHWHKHVGEDDENGHATQLQSSILEIPPESSDVPMLDAQIAKAQPVPTGTQWTVSTEHLRTQLEALSQTSKRLSLEGELVPVMCWKAITEWHKNMPITLGQLARLEQALREEIMCYGKFVGNRLLVWC